MVTFEFLIEGMTCVACSSAIENGLKNEFKDKGVVGDEKDGYEINVILLVHKMKISFYKSAIKQYNIDAKQIASEVEELGFGAEHINTYEFDINQSLSSSRSIRSSRGKQGDIENQKPQSSTKELKFIIKGMTCANCSNAIEKHLNSVAGVKSISVSLVTNKATVQADTDIIGPRKIIEEIEDIGFEAELQLKDSSLNIKDIVRKEVDKFKLKF